MCKSVTDLLYYSYKYPRRNLLRLAFYVLLIVILPRAVVAIIICLAIRTRFCVQLHEY